MVIKIILDTRRERDDSKFPVKMYFSNMRKIAMYSLDLFANESEFDANNGIFKLDNPKTRITASENNMIIMQELSRATQLLTHLRSQGRHNIPPAQFRKLYLNDIKGVSHTFNTCMREFIETKKGGTASIYGDTLQKIESKHKGELYFDDIDFSWLTQFEAHLIKSGLATNSISIHLRNIRAIYNYAIDTDIVGLDLYPFRRFKIKQAPVRKRAITLEQLRTLFEYSGVEHLDWAIDMARVIFYMIGINTIDLYNLNEYDNGYARYKRAKTHRLYSIKIEPELNTLLKKYQLKDGSLSVKKSMVEKSFMMRINRRLKDISDLRKLPHITTYTLRHTWATIASELEIPKETIAAALGHGGNTVTDIYIDFNQTKVDAANRQVMNYVLGIERD